MFKTFVSLLSGHASYVGKIKDRWPMMKTRWGLTLVGNLYFGA